jgi:Tfp pilus assembly PilM family ATPase
MFGLKKNIYSIGIDIDDNNLKLVQLEKNGNGVRLVAGFNEARPEDIKTGSSNWQRWAIEAIRGLITTGNFQGKEITAAMPASEVYIEHMKMPKVKKNELDDTIFARIKQKLPFTPVQANLLMKYIPTDQENILVMATERELVNRYLAIYEMAGLTIKSIVIWPDALVNCYTRFFGRRQSDIDAVVMLVNVDSGSTNVVICRHNNILFARSIPIGIEKSDDPRLSTLVLELNSFKRQFCMLNRNNKIDRLIFFSTRISDRDICAAIAKQLEMPAQMGDCLAAVEMSPSFKNSNVMPKEGLTSAAIDRRDCRLNWSVAFGLSLAQ